MRLIFLFCLIWQKLHHISFQKHLICFIDIDRNIMVSATKSETDYYRFHTYGFLCVEFGTQEEVQVDYKASKK